MARASVLVVDGYRGTRQLVHEVLRGAGYRCLLAADGLEAMDVFRRERPELVVTGVRVQIVNGIELLRRIRHEDSDTAVIVMTGDPAADIVSECYGLGAFKVLMKPFVIEELPDLRRARAGVAPAPDRAPPAKRHGDVPPRRRSASGSGQIARRGKRRTWGALVIDDKTSRIVLGAEIEDDRAHRLAAQVAERTAVCAAGSVVVLVVSTKVETRARAHRVQATASRGRNSSTSPAMVAGRGLRSA